uniref:Uncharacterized protein n=1 Tax=Panagrolaimus sp. ES5 TaxID=591445 RepID=A0AC34GA78_9BILA
MDNTLKALTTLLQKQQTPFVQKRPLKRNNRFPYETVSKIQRTGLEETSFTEPSNWNKEDNPFLSDESQHSFQSDYALTNATQHSFESDDSLLLNKPEISDIYEAENLSNNSNYFNDLVSSYTQKTPLPHDGRSLRDRASSAEIDTRKSEELAKYLLQKQDYGFTQEGELVSPNSKKIIKGSSHKDIAKYAVNTVGKNTPPGFKKVQQKLNEDPLVQNIRADPKGRFTIADWEN